MRTKLFLLTAILAVAALNANDNAEQAQLRAAWDYPGSFINKYPENQRDPEFLAEEIMQNLREGGPNDLDAILQDAKAYSNYRAWLGLPQF